MYEVYNYYPYHHNTRIIIIIIYLRTADITVEMEEREKQIRKKLPNFRLVFFITAYAYHYYRHLHNMTRVVVHVNKLHERSCVLS